MDSSELLSKLRVASAVMGSLPERPGYNGSVLLIDDVEAEEIVRALDAAHNALSAAPSTGAPTPANDDLDNIEDMLAGYAGVVKGCRSDELERFDYLPCIEGALEDFRRFRATIKAESAADVVPGTYALPAEVRERLTGGHIARPDGVKVPFEEWLDGWLRAHPEALTYDKEAMRDAFNAGRPAGVPVVRETKENDRG